MTLRPTCGLRVGLRQQGARYARVICIGSEDLLASKRSEELARLSLKRQADILNLRPTLRYVAIAGRGSCSVVSRCLTICADSLRMTLRPHAAFASACGSKECAACPF
jgi:hypothetical protein